MMYQYIIDILNFMGDKEVTISDITFRFQWHFQTAKNRLTELVSMKLIERLTYKSESGKKNRYGFRITDKGRKILEAGL